MRTRLHFVCVLAIAIFPGLAALAASRHPKQEIAPPPPDLQLLDGRKLSFERMFASEREVKLKRGFWNRLVDVIAGAPDFHELIRPYSIAADSHGKVIITDPGIPGVHVFDFPRQKYKFLSREGKDPFRSPQCVAVDDNDNFYITDSEAGKIFVYDSENKLRHVIGSLKGGEGFFKRPTGIAVDARHQQIYVSDTLRHQVFQLDMEGNVLTTIGKNGNEPGEFNFPTELKLTDNDLAVVDALNFRIQVLSRSGEFRYAIGNPGDQSGSMFRPKGIAFDSEQNLYVVDALWSVVQAFNHDGQLLYYFGGSGELPGSFNLPAGLFIDREDHVYVVDSYNRRVQVFRYSHPSASASGGMR